MTSHGKLETERLMQNLENQLDRLMEQLQDLETCREDLDDDEYKETKNDTVEQLNELNNSLNKLMNGDLSLINSLGAIRLATQAAISQAFKTPEVIRLFGKREPKHLRERLEAIENEYKQNKMGKDKLERQKAEILLALRQLGEQLTSSELQFLEKHNDISSTFKNMEFIEVNDD